MKRKMHHGQNGGVTGTDSFLGGLNQKSPPIRPCNSGCTSDSFSDDLSTRQEEDPDLKCILTRHMN